ncbi:MAG: RadC family protein [Oscillospiraceae bacterium]
MADEHNNQNIHKGHRQRMLKKYLEHGIDCFEDHEILEIFLYTAYSRRNTNDISHKLINKFGSLEGVLQAGFEELREVDDVGVTAAALISFMKDFARRFGKEDFCGLKLDTSESVRSFCFNLLKDCTTENAHVLFLDHMLNLIGETQISRGNADSVDFDMRLIVTRAIKTQCSNVILTHNHPGGILLPSSSDVASTRRVAQSLGNLGISLIDHIIVNEEDSYSMRAAQMLPDIWG